MRPPTEMFTVCVLSTAHLTKGTTDTLTEIVKARHDDQQCKWSGDDWRFYIIAERWSEYGWFVWAEVDADLPADLRACLDYATKHGCRWVQFDCDGPLEPELTRYEW